jgi:hypothetical protein
MIARKQINKILIFSLLYILKKKKQKKIKQKKIKKNLIKANKS